jgi:hypothetical protein
MTCVVDLRPKVVLMIAIHRASAERIVRPAQKHFVRVWYKKLVGHSKRDTVHMYIFGDTTTAFPDKIRSDGFVHLRQRQRF